MLCSWLSFTCESKIGTQSNSPAVGLRSPKTADRLRVCGKLLDSLWGSNVDFFGTLLAPRLTLWLLHLIVPAA